MRDGCCAGAGSPTESSGRKNGRQCMKTLRWRCQPGLPRKHPHGCGEDQALEAGLLAVVETPPRVWGRPRYAVWPVWAKGNTPTGVGKTAFRSASLRCMKKHPHGCGEDGGHLCGGCSLLETPPRVWGRPSAPSALSASTGNTPTGVGKTRHVVPRHPPDGKHPHGCGEDSRQRHEP